MSPLISVIVPVYNSEKYIGETVRSCLEQSYNNFELIIVNDGSTDRSEEIINEFKDPRIRYFKIRNSGPCRARNYGIGKAGGTVFQFLDADDVLDTDKLERQVRVFKVYGNNYVYSGLMGSIIKGEKSLEPNFDFYYKDLRVEEYFRKMFDHFGRYYTTGMWLVPKALVQQTHGWDEKILINNDGEYFSRIILHSKGIKFCPGAIFYYRKDVPGSVSKARNGKHLYESWLYSYSCYVKYFALKIEPNSARQLGRRALSVYYCNSYPKHPELLKSCKNQIRQLGYRSPVAHGGKTFKWLSAFLGLNNALKIRELKKELNT